MTIENFSYILSLIDLKFFILLAILTLPILTPVFLLRKRGLLIVKKRKEIKDSKSGKLVFLCDAMDDLGENLVQFYGEVIGGSIHSGMKILASGGMYEIKDVYADDNDLGKPSSGDPAGKTRVAIVIKASSFNFPSFRQELKKEGLISLEIK